MRTMDELGLNVHSKALQVIIRGSQIWIRSQKHTTAGTR